MQDSLITAAAATTTNHNDEMTLSKIDIFVHPLLPLLLIIIQRSLPLVRPQFFLLKIKSHRKYSIMPSRIEYSQNVIRSGILF